MASAKPKLTEKRRTRTASAKPKITEKRRTMMASAEPKLTVTEKRKMKIKICACASREIIDKKKAVELAARCEQKGWDVEMVADMCRWFEQNDERLKELEGSVVVACQERAVRSMLDWRGVKAGKVLNLRKKSVEEVWSEMVGDDGAVEAVSEECLERWQRVRGEMPREEGTDAWFPVIDRERCIACQKCHDFCLFGTYSLDADKQVRVVNPSHCKNNCPSCARMCPQQAIIFPKYPHSPINGGTEIEEVIDANMQEMYQAKLKERLLHRRLGVSLKK